MSQSGSAPPRSAYLAWVTVCLLWGTTYLAIRVAIETLPPFLMTAVRWISAGSILLIALKIRGERIPGPREWPGLTVLGILLMGFGNGLVVWAEQTIPSGLTAVLVAGVPFWMVGVERLLGARTPLTARRLIGLAIGFAGIVLLVWPDLELNGGTGFLFAVLATQGACLGWAIGSIYSRHRGSHENVLAMAAMQMLLGGLCILVVALMLGERPSPDASWRSIAAVLHLIVVGSVIGFSAYAYALKHLPVATVSLYAYVNPVIAVALGTLILGEPFSPRLVVAGGIVLLGMTLVRG